MTTEKPQSRSTKIRQLLADGKSVKDVAAALGCQPLAVYQVLYYDRKKGKKKAGRPKGSKNKPKDVVKLPSPSENLKRALNDLRIDHAHAQLENNKLRARLDEMQSQHRHVEATEHAALKELRNEVIRYRSMGFIERLGFLFRGV